MPIPPPLPPAPSDVLGKVFKWIAGISILEIVGGSAAILALRAAAEKHKLPVTGASAEILLSVIGISLLLFVTLFAIIAFILVKVVCDCGTKCGCSMHAPNIPDPPAPPDIPLPPEAQKVLDDLKRRLRDAQAELADAVSSGNLITIKNAREKVADLEKQILNFGD